MTKTLEKAIELLAIHKLVLIKDEQVYISDKKGISPMIEYLQKNINLDGFSAADIIVGKAVAALFVKAGIKEVYGEVMSLAAIELLTKHGITYHYKYLTEKIINRDNTGICPMEQTVKDCDDIEKCYHLLKNKVQELRNNIK